jgi:cytochrome c-type biogenesis protein CcmH
LPRRILLLLAVLALAGSRCGIAGEGAVSELDQVTGKLICDCGCSNLTVKECTCGKADRVREEVSARLASGQTPDQVVKAYVDEYGEQILAAPTGEGFNLVGWILPFVAVLLGGTFLIVVLRRWARVPWSEAPLVSPLGSEPPPRPDPAFLRKVQEDLDARDR